MEIKMNALRGLDIAGKKILFRPDINSPIDPVTKKIVNENRLKKNAVTLKYMLENGAAVALIAHQGDTKDYQNLIPLEEHAEKLSDLTGYPVHYIDDVCGPAAIEAVKNLPAGEAIILGNLRYLGEELSTFSNFVKLKPEDMGTVWHIRKLSPLFDLYVNDAFSAAHRDAPSMVGFPHFLPAAAGFQFFDEYAALASVKDGAEHPCMFVLGGAKISDAFGMMESVLKNGTADKILTTGVTGIIMHIANGVTFGEPQMKFLRDRDMLSFVDAAKKLTICRRMRSLSTSVPRQSQIIRLCWHPQRPFSPMALPASMSRMGSTSVHAESGAALLTATPIPLLAAVTPYPAQPSLLI